MLLRDIVDQFQRENAGDQVSIALRGSVARGAAVSETADLDLVVLFDDGAVLPDTLRSDVLPNMPIEKSYVPRREFLTDDKWRWMRFTLAHNGHTIWGTDHLADLPEPHLGAHCYAHLRNADEWLEHWQVFWDRDKDYHAICMWLMKRIVRSLFESQIMRLNAYSRDIYPCSTVAAEAFPDLGSIILGAAQLAVSPTDNRNRIAEVTARLSPTLLSLQAEFEKRLLI
ncbi:nucleotidyltransferase domain-containing protein [uncultured Tateyamaria sp.]|uniref:nucleotidyltransferase domain-containing protein n=1 Tax=uncultured Tateyamaria sp. TaxID=455651 RepID=UPI002638D1C9|nr:nucleotidyltransferase domain-containing protein [uncultured Tateyamaria sp.]